MAKIFVDETTIKATSDHLTLTLKSGGETFQFHLPHAVAVTFWGQTKRDMWPLHCAPNGALVEFPTKKVRKAARNTRV